MYHAAAVVIGMLWHRINRVRHDDGMQLAALWRHQERCALVHGAMFNATVDLTISSVALRECCVELGPRVEKTILEYAI